MSEAQSLIDVDATVIAFALRRRTAAATGQAPPAWLIGLVSLVLLLGHVLILGSWGWIGLVLGLILPTLLGMILLGCSRRAGWVQLHVLAGAGGALMAYAIIALWVNPEQVSTTALVLARGAVIVGVLVMLILAALRIRRASRNPEAGSSPVLRAGVPTKAGDDDR
ncbi:MAG TPA: hypothetical protein VIP98_04475 [Microlunatus sp.]